MLLARSCVRCGYCCMVAPCPFGQGVPCEHLVMEVDSLVYSCAIYSSIVKERGADISPSFGSGCGSTLFNSQRSKFVVDIMEYEWATVNECNFCGKEGGEYLVRVGPNIICTECLAKLRKVEENK